MGLTYFCSFFSAIFYELFQVSKSASKMQFYVDALNVCFSSNKFSNIIGVFLGFFGNVGSPSIHFVSS